MSAQNEPDTGGDDLLLRIRGLKIEGRTEEGWSEIVHGVDLDLRRGEVLGLIGESGAGKSTIGLAAMGFARDGCRLSAGTIEFDGRELRAAPETARRKLRGNRIAYVAQSAAAAFNPAHRLMDQYCEGPVQHGVMGRAEAESDAIQLFERIRLPDPETIGFRYPHQVSGGQLQRAMTAMAMACRPDLIVFDEPTTALDVTTQIEVLAAIRDAVQQFGTAAIYITHDLAVVAQMADRIMVLRHGLLVEEGDTRSLLSDPQEDYTRELLQIREFQVDERRRPADAAPVLEMRGVTAGYGAATILHDVSFQIHKKRTVAVVGESGSGKSTAARVITGLLPPTAGEVLYNGEALPPRFDRRTKDQLRRLQMIYQMADTALNPKQRVRDVIGRPLEFYLGLTGAQKRERVRALLEMIELEPDTFIDRLPGELSGGQKQRICIARALAAEPEVILCDEVTSALDPLVAEGILKLLDRLQDEFDLSYMFITHDLATVRAIADEVVVMHRGKVVESGPKSEMFTPPHHDYTDLLLSSVPEMDPDWLDRLLAERAELARQGRVLKAADN
ncbi:MAG: ABC transporter ATP-binding protein [Thalassobaculum sp.]|uniref:ABC transporter ATP-binding protein n=1 Tax=Thalassobaculum sp. TaxID=2022740 RepID=UPI0032EB27C7